MLQLQPLLRLSLLMRLSPRGLLRELLGADGADAAVRSGARGRRHRVPRRLMS